MFAQDSWKISPTLTLNYGLRWEFDTPLTDVLHHVQTFRPGQNTTVYPCQLTAIEQTIFGVRPPCCGKPALFQQDWLSPATRAFPPA